MTIAIVGVTAASFNSQSSTIVATRNGVAAGNALLILITTDAVGGIATPTYADDKGGSYSANTDLPTDTTNTQALGASVALNHPGGNTQVTVSLGASHDFRGIAIVELSGVHPSAGLTGHNGQFQLAPVGTDSVSSGTITPAGAAGLLFGLSAETTGATVPTAGTGMTSQGTLWDFGLGGGTSPGFGGTTAGFFRVVTASFTSTASIAALFTPGAGSLPHITLGVALKEAVSRIDTLFFGSGTTS